MKFIVALLAVGCLAGCAGTMEAFYGRPVTEDQLITDDTGEQELGTLSVTAQRRVIVGNLKTGQFCSEPPPEAADEVTTALAAALSANIAADKTVNAELASNFARHVNQLYKRSHTVQILRDASFHLCVDAVNSGASYSTKRADGAVAKSQGEYQSYKSSVVDLVKSLIPSLDKEVELYYKTETVRAEHSTEKQRSLVLCSASAGRGDSADGKATGGASVTCTPLEAEEKGPAGS